MNRTKTFGISLVAALFVLSTSGCTDTPGASPTTADTPSQSAEGSLDFDTVQRLTAPRFETDPNCVAGKWSSNSTGIDDEHLPSATTIQQFDCYDDPAKVDVAFPTRGQQSTYVEFRDASAARAFADDEAVLYKILVDQNRVVVAGTGLDTVDMQAYLKELQAACNCGEVITS